MAKGDGDRAEGSSTLKRLSRTRPAAASFGLLLAALALRLNDIYVLRLDERLGEIFLSKLLGFALILGYLRSSGGRLKDIGFHSAMASKSVGMGLASSLLTLAGGYGAELLYLHATSAAPSFLVAPIDPKTGLRGDRAFGAWLVGGNLVNSFMEEGLFRGILITHLRSRLSFWRTNLLQAALFGAWHLVWAPKSVLTHQMGLSEAAGSGLSLFVASGIQGFAWGYLYLKTNSLWSSWSAHTVSNTVMNLLHTAAAGQLNPGLTVRGLFMTLGAPLAMQLTRSMARRIRTPEVVRWGHGAGSPTT